ncbi:MAG: lamin tail domain-containing protein [Byssovorax sp.]
MRSSFRSLHLALPLLLSLAGGCARGNQATDGVGGGGGAVDMTSSASVSATSTTTSTSSATTTTGAGGGSTSSGGGVCGDGVVDAGEECDGAAPGGKACIDCKLVDLTTPVINEIVYDPAGPDVGCFIEILGPAGLDLAGYTLEAVNGSDGALTPIAALTGQTIGASGYFVVAQDASVVVPAGANKLIKGTADLQNGPDSLVLKHSGTVVDALGYGSFAMGQFFKGEKFPAMSTAASLGRYPNGKDTDDNSVDFLAGAPTPGAANKLAP